MLGLELSQSQARQLIASCEISSTRCLRQSLCFFPYTNSRVTPYKIVFQVIEDALRLLALIFQFGLACTHLLHILVATRREQELRCNRRI